MTTLNLDRAIGCLLDLAVALGAPLEFSRRDSLPKVADMIGGGPFNLPPGYWTDDTSMALCLGERLVLHRGVNRTTSCSASCAGIAACTLLDRRDAQ